MPTIVPQESSPAHRVKPDVIISEDVICRVDPILHGIINTRFENVLKVSKMPAKDTPGQMIWIISSKNPDYLFGFRVSLKGNILQVKSGINTWSMWAEDYARAELARQLEGKFQVGTKLVIPDPPIGDFSEWAVKFGITEKFEKLPADFRTAAGLK